MYNNVEMDFFSASELSFDNTSIASIHSSLYNSRKFSAIFVGLFCVFRSVNCTLPSVSLDPDIWLNLKVNTNYILDYRDDDPLK